MLRQAGVDGQHQIGRLETLEQLGVDAQMPRSPAKQGCSGANRVCRRNEVTTGRQ
jgi:hypothetical protein